MATITSSRIEGGNSKSTTRVIAISRRSSSADAIRSRLLFKLGIVANPHLMDPTKRRISPRRISSLSTSASSVSSNSSSDHQDTQEEDNVDDGGIGNNTASLQPSSSTETSDHYCIPIKFGKEESHEVQSSSSSSASASNTNEDTNKPNLFEPPISISNSISVSKEDTASNTNPYNKKKSSAVLSPPPSSLTFSPLVKVIPIPSHKTYPPNIHSQLYQSKYEMTCNAARNTREYIYEGWGDFNNVIEEDGMYSMNKMNGTMLVHPVHIVDYIAARRI